MTLRVCIISGVILLALSLFAPAAHAQFSIPWSTLDCGGGATSGGAIALRGTIAQPDSTASAALSGGTFTITGGFWPAAPCPADYNLDASVSVQDIFDFLAGWFASDPRADFNGANSVTVQDIFDFLASWFNGC